MNWSRVVPSTIRSLHQGDAPVICSDANASHQSPEITCGKAFNFSLDSKVSVLDIVSQITTLMGKESLRPVILNEAKGEILHQYLSSEKANNILGWSPAYNLEQGLDETIAWYVDFLDQQSH